MSRPLRATVYLAGGVLWLTGALWLVLHFGFPEATPFGPLPNPWEPVLMRLHGLAAAGALFLLGWVTASHVSDRWRGVRNRLSGLTLGASAGVLAVTGYALYYSTGALHEGAALLHECLGIAAVALIVAHRWRVRGRRRP